MVFASFKSSLLGRAQPPRDGVGRAVRCPPLCTRNAAPARSGLRAQPSVNDRLRLLALIGWVCVAALRVVAAAEGDGAREEAERNLQQAQKEAQDQPENDTAAWQLGRACFRLARMATNRTERAEVAEQGTAACQRALTLNSNSAPAHYYLGLNLGQLARTRTLGALKLVGQMEVEFTWARQLQPAFDNGGPDRVLGLLYQDAPAIGSIGSRSKAREHMQLAIATAPTYPDNRLNLIEAELKWGNGPAARRELKELEKILPRAQADFNGSAWTGPWADWQARLQTVKTNLESTNSPSRSPRHKR